MSYWYIVKDWPTVSQFEFRLKTTADSETNIRIIQVFARIRIPKSVRIYSDTKLIIFIYVSSIFTVKWCIQTVWNIRSIYHSNTKFDIY